MKKSKFLKEFLIKNKKSYLIIRQLKFNIMAVREGFEPSVPKRYSDLAGQCIRPLCHLTKLTKYMLMAEG